MLTAGLDGNYTLPREEILNRLSGDLTGATYGFTFVVARGGKRKISGSAGGKFEG